MPGNLSVSTDTVEMITGDDDVDCNGDDKDMDVAGNVVGDEDDVEEEDDNPFTCCGLETSPCPLYTVVWW